MTAVFAIALSKAALKKYVYSQGYLLVCSKIRFTEIESLRLLKDTETEPLEKKKTCENRFLHRFYCYNIWKCFKC